MSAPTAQLRVKGTASKFVKAIGSGWAREIACFGARGDRKTNAALIGFIAHARRHAELGYRLPVRWIGATDTLQAHKLKTIRSMQLPHWAGGWTFRDDYRLASFSSRGTEWVRIDLFGVEDQGAMDRVRMECHGVWFEEPAPAAAMIGSSGISDTAWRLAITSQRLPTHAHVAVITSNYPDEDHWTWTRFVKNPAPGTLAFRIPPGENASAEDRAAWAEQLADRPDLLARLVNGEPGIIIPGQQVADGFRLDSHVRPVRLNPGEPVGLGIDFGHTPTVVLGQLWRGQMRVKAAFTEKKAGIRQLLVRQVIPWISDNAPWLLRDRDLMLIGYDQSGNTGEEADIDQSPIRVVEELLGTETWGGPVSWEGRKGPLLSAINRVLETGERGFVVDPEAKDLISALSGRWHYPKDRFDISRDKPKKPNHPWEDLGDATCYLISRLLPDAEKFEEKPEDPLRDLDAASRKYWENLRKRRNQARGIEPEQEFTDTPIEEVMTLWDR